MAVIEYKSIGLGEDFRIFVTISRRAATKNVQCRGAGVFDTMCRARRNGDAVANPDRETVLAQLHDALSLSDVVNLFGQLVPVQERGRTRLDDGFGQALLGYAMLAGVEQFADCRAILGDIWADLAKPGVTGPLAHLPPQG